MSRWFRHYAGMMRDDKLVRVAIRSKQTIERVAWVWGAILESAAEIDDNGKYDMAADEAAYFLRADEADIRAITTALQDAGRLDQDRVVNWGNRQFSSDKSKDRQAAYRERQKAGKGAVRGDRDGSEGNGDAVVTSQSRHGDAPETETELETDIPPKAPRKREGAGVCFPPDWQLPPVSALTPKAKACAEQWTKASYETEGEGFILYWRQSRKRRPDWLGTWCAWVIRQHSKVVRDQKFGNAPTDAAPAANWDEDRKAALLASIDERERKVVPIGQMANDILRQAGRA